tara:strand:- start:332 stop:1075 length:744 start_codon:yes stop_codon:yes gene_type:complete
MAIPASGSVSLSTIQSEWGGSNPISMSEYYSGSLATNSTSSSISPTVGNNTSSTYFPGQKYQPAYTQYTRTGGFKNSNITGNISGGIGSSSGTWTTTSGIDQVGNAGQIPSSGAIQFNHFRGTNGSASSSNLVCYGFKFYQISTTSASSGFAGYISCYIAGHYGTSYSGSSWTNVPFRWIDSPAKNGLTASRWYGSDTHVNNGMNTGRLNCIHETWPNIGATTRYLWNTNFTSTVSLSGTWTLTVQR